MNGEEIDGRLRAANPFSAERLGALQLETAEADLARALFADPCQTLEVKGPRVGSRRGSQRKRVNLLAVAVALIFTGSMLLLGGGPGSPPPAYSARLSWYAASAAPFVLEAPHWRLGSADNLGNGAGRLTYFPARRGVQGTVELSWHNVAAQRLLRSSLGEWVRLHSSTTTVPGSGTLVEVRAGKRAGGEAQGGGARREMVAIWQEGGRVLMLRAAPVNLAAFRERLGWLRRVDAQNLTTSGR